MQASGVNTKVSMPTGDDARDDDEEEEDSGNDNEDSGSGDEVTNLAPFCCRCVRALTRRSQGRRCGGGERCARSDHGGRRCV